MCLTCQALQEASALAAGRGRCVSERLPVGVELPARGLGSHPFLVATRNGELTVDDVRVLAGEAAQVSAAALAAATRTAELSEGALASAAEELAATLASETRDWLAISDVPPRGNKQGFYETRTCATVIEGTTSTGLGPLLARLFVISLARPGIGTGNTLAGGSWGSPRGDPDTDDRARTFLCGATDWATEHERSTMVHEAARRTTTGLRGFYDALEKDRATRAASDRRSAA